MWCVPTVLVYALRGNEVLLLRRGKEPNLGLWVAPGGKIKLAESPHEAARREMAEETGLEAESLDLRGFCTLMPFVKQWPWLVFVYVTTRFRGTLRESCAEGELAWLPLEEYLATLPKPQADAIFAPRILAGDGLFQAKFVYDADLTLAEWVEY
jgi:8-oxo-dGTP diphosphatase